MLAGSTALVLSEGEAGSEEIIVIDPSDLTMGMASGIRKMNLQNGTREALRPGDLEKVLALMEQSENPKVANLLRIFRQGIAEILSPTKKRDLIST